MDDFYFNRPSFSFPAPAPNYVSCKSHHMMLLGQSHMYYGRDWARNSVVGEVHESEFLLQVARGFKEKWTDLFVRSTQKCNTNMSHIFRDRGDY